MSKYIGKKCNPTLGVREGFMKENLSLNFFFGNTPLMFLNDIEAPSCGVLSDHIPLIQRCKYFVRKHTDLYFFRASLCSFINFLR